MSEGVDAENFVTEVHRYGVTVVSYTWSMLREILHDKNFQVNEHNPIRLFMGSGLPTGLWDEIGERFPRARVLEFFATADGSAILANVAADKVGSMGRALPETNEVAIAAYDVDAERLVVGESGFVDRAGQGEVGLLLARSRHRFDTTATVLRDVFAPKDRWEVSGHLFYRDSDDDLWFMGSVDTVAHSVEGPIYLPPIEQLLSRVPGVDQVAAYRLGDPGSQIVVAALTMRSDVDVDSLTVTQLRLGLGALPAHRRPHLVWIVDEIPVSESYRPQARELAARGVPKPGSKVWYRDSEGRYRRFTKTAVSRVDWLPASADSSSASSRGRTTSAKAAATTATPTRTRVGETATGTR